MRMKKSRMICIILSILMFFSGMCFEDIKTDALSACAPVLETNACMAALDAAEMDVTFCTRELLGIQNVIGIRQLKSRYISQKKEAKISFDFLCSDVFSLYEGKFFTSSETIQIQNRCLNELVTNYIHKTDGKK